MPGNYSIVNAPVVLAIFMEDQTCQLDTTINVHGEKRRKEEVDFGKWQWLFLLLLLLLLLFRDHLVSQLGDSQSTWLCVFFDELVPAITIMGPLASLFAAIESVDDFGYFYFEPYGVLPSYQHSGLSLTMINVPAWRRVEEILSSQANVTASMTPCKEGKTHTYTPTTPFESSPSSPSSSSSSCLDVGNYIEDARSPALKGYRGVFISFYVRFPFALFLLPLFLNDSFCLCL